MLEDYICMKEFGSDFYVMPDFCNTESMESKLTIYDVYKNLREYACGRHAIESIYKYKGWHRLWIPAYFCYEVIDYLVSVGINIKLYNDTPLNDNDDDRVRSLPYKDGDALLRMNFFGLRDFRSNAGISVPVIEDHTHDLFSEWAKRSDADYCIASIRKTMPTAAGGILWSPRHLCLPESIAETSECKNMTIVRYEAMQMKYDYIYGNKMDNKDAFREKYIKTEKIIDKLPLSGMDKETLSIAKQLNYKIMDHLKTDNWHIANDMLKDSFCVLRSINPFSIIILCDTEQEREALRMHLIKRMIYPAILWQIPENTESNEALDFSRRMLSIHCDARYSRNAIKEMCERILSFRN